MAVHRGSVMPGWIAAAEAKGFDIAARVIDCLHLALCCRTCGHVFVWIMTETRGMHSSTKQKIVGYSRFSMTMQE